MAAYSYFEAWGLTRFPQNVEEAREAAKRIACCERHGKRLVATPEIIDALEGVNNGSRRDIPGIVGAHLEVIVLCKEGLVGENARETQRLECAITAFRRKYGQPVDAVA